MSTSAPNVILLYILTLPSLHFQKTTAEVRTHLCGAEPPPSSGQPFMALFRVLLDCLHKTPFGKKPFPTKDTSNLAPSPRQEDSGALGVGDGLQELREVVVEHRLNGAGGHLQLLGPGVHHLDREVAGRRILGRKTQRAVRSLRR